MKIRDCITAEDARKYLDYRKTKVGDVAVEDLIGFYDFIIVCFLYPTMFQDVKLKSPTIVQWNVTNRCNASCIHCYANSGPHVRTDELTIQEAYTLIDQLSENQVLSVSLTGGEPFLRKDIMEIIAYVKENHIACDLLTNGSLITQKIARHIAELFDTRIDTVQISLDGPTAEIHNAQRRAPLFRRTLEGISNLVEQHIPVDVKFVPTHLNVMSMKDTYYLAKKLGATAFSIGNPVSIGRGSNIKREAIDPAYILRTVIELHDLRLSEGGPKIYDGFVTEMYNFSELRKIIPRKKIKTVSLKCSAAIGRASIDSEGNVYPCVFLQDPSLIAGNIREKDLKLIWDTGKNWEEIRRGRDFKKFKCGSCEFLNTCKSGCMGAAYGYYRTIHAPDPGCLWDPGGR